MAKNEVRITPPPILFNVAIEGPDSSHLVNWGNDRGWVDRLRPQLDAATRISLIPKDPTAGLPVVTVRLDEPADGDARRRWVLLSRVFGRITQAGQQAGAPIRLYLIGWQATVGGRNVKALLWVYPNGSVEAADEPSFVDLFLDRGAGPGPAGGGQG